MRRFEKNGRFWEVGLQGRSVTTRSGSVSGTPRTSSKGFATAKAALAEIDKRLTKRMGEAGWIEVLPPFEGVVDLLPRIEGLDQDKVDRRKRVPNTLSVHGVVAARTVTKNLGRSRERWIQGLSTSTLDPQAKEALAHLLKKGPAFIHADVVQRSVLLAVAPEAETADLLVARFGLPSLVEAIAVGPRFAVQRDLHTARLVEGEPKSARVRPAVARARDLLLASTEAEHAACEAIAQGALGSPQRDIELVALFPSTAWGDEVLLARGLDEATMEVAWAASPETFRSLVARRRPNRHTTPARLLPSLEILMQRHGLEALPALKAVAKELGSEGATLSSRVRTPETVLLLVEQLEHETTASSARAALIELSDLTLATLLSEKKRSKAATALGQELALQPGLLEALRPHLAPDQLRTLARWVGEEDALPVMESLPVALQAGMGDRRPLEPWIRLPLLPALRTPGGAWAYPPQATARALERLSQDHGTVEEGQEDPAVDVARELLDACDPDSLDALLAEVLTTWSEHAADGQFGTSPWSRDDDGEWVRDPKAPEHIEHPWVLRAVALLGGVTSAKSLFTCILGWGRKGGRYKELLPDAVDVMCGLPSDETVVHLGALARRLPATRVRIERHLAKAARRRGLDPEDLDEVLLPSLGLDANGNKSLDFGSRTFTVGFDNALEPTVTDANHQPLKALPRGNKSDDKDKVKAARKEWSELKKQVRTLRTTLIGRLVKALRTQREIPVAHFKRYLLEHPLGGHAVAGLIWCNASERFGVVSGRPVALSGETLPLEGTVRLVHPVELADEERRGWKAALTGRGIVQPFPQLDRNVYGLEALDGLHNQFIERGDLFALRSRGWHWHSSSQIDGQVYEEPMIFALTLALQGVTVRVSALHPVEAVGTGGFSIGAVGLAEGRWEDLSAILISEIGRDLRHAIDYD